MEQPVTHMASRFPSTLPSEMLFGFYSSRAALLPADGTTDVLLFHTRDSAKPVDIFTRTVKRKKPRGNMPILLGSERNRIPAALHSTEKPASQDIRTEKESALVPTILVVEDDPDISLVLYDLLEAEGFHVNRAETCSQAFSLIEQHVYAAVLLDLGLPDGDGCSILEKLQKTHPPLPVIVLTAINRDLGSLHPYAYLTKPWDRKELCRLLQQAIGTTPSPIKD